MTALAAVLALSSVPSFAQSVADPVVTTTPVVDVTPAPVVVDPIAPADTAVAVDPVVTRTTSTTARKTTTTKSTATHARPAPVRAATVARSIASAAPAAAITVPIAAAPVVPALPVEPVAAAPAAAAPVATAPATTIDILPTAGLAGLGLLVLVGGALVLRSRRRRRLDEIEDAEWQQNAEAQAAADADLAPIVAPEPVLTEPEPVMAAPALVVATALEPTAESETKFIGPETELSDDFDLSRFGPNVQDAYRGPTEDNPSASLKQRLRRANGMDQQERKLDAEVEAATGESVLDEIDAAPATATPTAAQPKKGDFIFARGNHESSVTPTIHPSKVN
ncbi:MAG: hypothetical protein ABIT68_05960 [Sphingomicrobium sp.]